MGWDDTNKKMSGAVSHADISYPTSQGGPSYVMGSMVYYGSGYLNVAAKYKPVEHSNPGILSEAERRSVRYGFGSASTVLPALPLSNNAQNPKNNWQYIPPSTWWRNLDFVKEVGSNIGYNGRAIMPLKVSIGQLVTTAESIVLVMCNAAVNSVPGISPRAWDADTCVSLDDLLVGDYSYYLQFLFVDTDNGVRNLVVCNKQLSSAITASAGGFVYQSFYYYGASPYYTEVSGIKYPDVPVLANSEHTIRVIVGIGGGPSLPDSSYAYQVITDQATINGWVMYSLGLEDNCDRDTAVVQSGAFVMDGTQITSFTVAAQDMDTQVVYGGITWRKYMITVRGVFDTTNVSYSGMTVTINGTLTLSNTASYVFGASPDSGNSTITPAASALNLAGGTAGQGRDLFTSGNNTWLWVPVAGQGLPSTTVSASVIFTNPFNTPLSNPSPNPTVVVP